MPYTDWQIRQIRAALRDHQKYFVPDGTELIWQAVADQIEEYTGLLIPHERLRKFVNGESKKKPGKLSSLEEPRLEAVVQCLMHPDIAALTDDELKQFDRSYHAPRRLQQYLEQSFDPNPGRLPDELDGIYQTDQWLRDPATERELKQTIQIEIRLDVPKGGDLIRAYESVNYYDDPKHEFRRWTGSEREDHWVSGEDSYGWGLVTPEDNLLLLMKQRSFGENHFWTLGAAARLWEETAVERLVLQRQGRPAEIDTYWEGNFSVREKSRAFLLESVFEFRRTGPF